MDDITIGSDIVIPASAVHIQFSRSGGKGGQHVNKVSTKVELFVSIDAVVCEKKVKLRIANNLKRTVDSEGTLRVVSQSSRSQYQNKQTAIEKLTEIIRQAAVEATVRVATKPTISSRRRRIDSKKKAGKKKQLRNKNIIAHS